MTPLFPRWADPLFRTLLACSFFGGALGIPLGLMAWMQSPLHTDVGRPLAQPVQFDHRHHVQDDGIDCLYCHYDARRAPSAGMPETATCMGCHAQIRRRSSKLELVRRSWYESEPIVWRRVSALPDFVYFDHSIHVRQGVGCEVCHGRVDLMAAVYATETLQMGWCLGCHRHPERYLRPRSKVTQMGYVPGESQEVLGPRLVAAYGVAPPTYCSGCHR